MKKKELARRVKALEWELSILQERVLLLEKRLPPEVGAISVSGQSEPQLGASLPTSTKNLRIYAAGVEPSPSAVDHVDLRSYEIMPDGIFRECVP